MKKKCIALLLAAFMLVSPGASTLAETTEQPSTEFYETSEFTGAGTEISETETSETEIPETETSETEISETEIPETEIPETATSETEIPETETSETEIPETETSETEIPETETSETEIPETETSETEIPETETSETEIPETETIETESTEDILEVNIFDLLDGLSTEDTEEVLYTVSFNANGGNGSMEPQTFVSGTSAALTANAFERNGYKFTGWALSKKGDVAYNNKATLDPDNAKWDENNALTLYAKWEAKEYKITYKLNDGKNNKSNPSTYTIKTKTIKLKNPTRKGYGFGGWYTDKKFKNKITKIKKGSTGKITLYAKWEKEYKATSTSAKITSCKATAVNTIKVKATIEKRVKSSDNYYYLVTIDPNTNKILRKVAKTDKSKKISFQLDTRENRGYALAKYAIAIKSGDKYKQISKTSANISNPEKLAAYTSAYHLGATKKGLQISSVGEATETGCGNVFLNLNISSVLSGDQAYTYNGKTYHFSTGGCSGAIEMACNAGLNVTMQIMLDEAAYKMDSSLVAKEARSSGHPYYTWNTKDKKAREKMEALFCFLAETFGTDERYVSNWILGNEVNADYAYHWRGSMSDGDFLSSYAYSYRVLYSAVRSVRSSSRVFICLDDMWTHNNVAGGIPSKTFLDTFAKKVNKLQKNVSWNVAFHPYTANIFEPSFWDDSSCPAGMSYLVTNSTNSPFVTMKNLNVLTDYVKNTYGKEHRIILSEIGFNGAGSSNQTKQAAALAYAYNKAACNDMVDAFIIRTYRDDAGEAAQGLYFGLTDSNGKKRPAYNVFKYMDTKKAEKYTKKYVKTCGGSSWKSLVKGYSTKKLYTNNGMK